MKQYEEFKQEFQQAIKPVLEQNGYSVNFQTITKNNNQILDGILIKKNTSYAVTIYTNFIYEVYQSGASMDDLINQVLDITKENFTKLPTMPKFTREETLNHIFPVVVNAEKNKEFLKDKPHKYIAEKELAVYLRQRVDNNATFAITYDLLKTVKISKNTAFAQALQNTKNAYQMIHMSDLLEQLTGIPSDNNEIPMYIITNQERNYGAGFLFHQEVMAKFFTKFKESVYIIPSSIHECIIVPCSVGDLEDIKEMVSIVNATEVSAEEFLSNEVFTMDENQNLVICKEMEKDKKYEDKN